MNGPRSLASLEALKVPPTAAAAAQMLICSEESFVAADGLRSALADLQAAYALLQELLELAQSQAPTPNKDI